jgi:hypothetical protein
MLKVFVPIVSVDRKAKILKGFLPKNALESQNLQKRKFNQIGMSDLAKAVAGYDGCLRAGQVAAGRVVKLAADDGAVAVHAKITDYLEWEKVLESVYTAFVFSIKEAEDGRILHMIFLSDAPNNHDDLERAERIGGLAKTDFSTYQSPLWAMKEALKHPVRFGFRDVMRCGAIHEE